MAKQQKRAEEKQSLPDGFDAANLSGEQFWSKPKEGKEILGELLGRMVRRGGKGGAFYRIKVENKVECDTGRGDEKHTLTVDPGTVVNVDEKAALQDLAAYCPDGDRRYKVFIRYEKKEDGQDGKTFWRVTLGKKQISGSKPGDVPF